MSKRVTLRHQDLNVPIKVVHFYDGFVTAHNGVVDAVVEDWNVENIWRQGYNLTPDGRKLFDLWELNAYIEELNSVDENQPQEEQVEQEGTDSRGLASDTDGLRQSESEGGESVPVEGLESGVSGGSDDSATEPERTGDTDVLPRPRRSRRNSVSASTG